MNTSETSGMQAEKKSTKISPSQREAMLQFMIDHPALATGRFTSPDGAKNRARLLEEMTTVVNSCASGASKSGEKWIKSWQDWRSDVKSKAAKQKRHAVGTGGGAQSKLTLTNLEERLLAFLGPDCVFGVSHPDTLDVQRGASHQQPEDEGIMVEGHQEGNNYVLNLPDLDSQGEFLIPSSPEIYSVASSSRSISPPTSGPSPAPSSGKKRRRTQSDASACVEADTILVRVFEEKNEIGRQKLKLEQERIEIDRERLQLEKDTSLRTSRAIEKASESFCFAMQMMADYFQNRKL